jgi:aspartyl-tRNA(Asn)/glutamyl-tRNA(Gln) amidotransferase subunit A
MFYRTINDLKKAYKQGLKPREYITNLLLEIPKLDLDTKSIVRLYPDKVTTQLNELENMEKQTELSLFGIPFLIKDNILVEGFEVTAQSKILEGFVAPYDADVISKLKAQGAIVIGQTNMDEFAFGSSTEYSGYGQVTTNPHDTTRVAGGTSGGSASAICLALVPFALGTDTGGSIRQPASFTGIYGLRPTYGSVSRYGVIPSASSFDQVGPMANALEDLELVFSVLEGKSLNDQTSIDTTPKGSFDDQKTKIRVGVCSEFLNGLAPQIKETFDKEILEIKQNSLLELVEISLPLTKFILPVYYILQTVEASSNLERFDQVRFAKNVEILSSADLYFKAREDKLGEEVKRRIMLGTYTSSAGYYDAYYNQACKVRKLIQDEYAKAFENIDVMVMPASPFEAFEIGGKTQDPMAMYTADIMTVSQPIARLPALVLPFGKVGVLPVGLQLVASEKNDYKLLEVAKLFDKQTQN